MFIHSRRSWGARAPRAGRATQQATSVREFFVHWPGEGVESYSNIDTPAEEEAVMRKFQNFHMDGRGWADFAYGFAIFPSGRIYRGRGMEVVPASQLNHNTGTTSVVCVLGSKDRVPPAMEASLRELIRWADGRAHRKLTVRPHRAVTATDCPGPKLAALVLRLN